MTERVFSASLDAANAVTEGGFAVTDSLGGFGGGKLGMAMRRFVAYCADGFVGGVCDGISVFTSGPETVQRPCTPSTPS